MTYGRTVKQALMNCGIWPRYTKFTEPPGWGDMNADTQSSLRREHSAAKSAHDKEHEWKWTEKAAQREEWRTLIRGPDPPKRAARPKSTRVNGRRGDSRQVTSHLTNPWGAAGRERISCNASYAEHSPTPCNYRSAGPKGKQQHPLVYDISSSSDNFYSSCPEDTKK